MAYRNKNELLDIEGDLIGWDDESSISLTNEALERDAAAERSTPSMMKKSWKPRRKKPRRPVKSG